MQGYIAIITITVLMAMVLLRVFMLKHQWMKVMKFEEMSGVSFQGVDLWFNKKLNVCIKVIESKKAFNIKLFNCFKLKQLINQLSSNLIRN